ncbi:MAG: glycerate kinase, partial [Sulfolobales archaeon]
HPIPRENTKRSSEILIEYLSNIREEDLVLILISGGGSALFEIPLPGLDLDDLAVTTDMLMRSGADIIELNIVRKHLSSVKGGRLLRYIKSREIYSLIMSDVIGDPISFIASGPTEADETTYNDAINVLRRRGLWDRVPGRVREILVKGSTGLIEESVKPGDEVLRRVKNIIVASNMMSLRAIERKARENNLNTLFLGPYVRGEAREVGRVIASILRSIRLLGEPVRPPVAIVSGGETTVTVRGRGVGGRNQETCLSIMIDIRDLDDIHFACVGSDGIDGISPAAGAIVDSRGYWEALELGLDPVDYLDRNDSYTILKKINRVIETGPTGTNVGDFYVGIVARAT